MTSWLALGVLMLVSFSKASMFSNGLDNQMKEGIEKISETEKFVQKKVEEVNREINKVSLYFSRAINESTIGSKKIYNDSIQKVEKIITKKFEEGIDKDRDIMVLLYILETMQTTKNKSDETYDTCKSCLKNVLGEKSNELEKLKNLFEFTQKFFTGFYQGLRVNMKNCKDGECIKQLVQAAEKKKKSLTNMFEKYVKEMPNISTGLQEGHQDCMDEAHKNFSEVLKKLENDLKQIRTNGMYDLTDRFDSVILEL